MKDYQLKLERLHKEAVKEGIISDAILFVSLKQLFGISYMPPFQFQQLKSLILKFLKEKGLKS